MDATSIAAMATQMKTSQIQAQYGTAMLGKAMDTQKMQGEQMLKLLNSSAIPPAVSGVGQLMDVLA